MEGPDARLNGTGTDISTTSIDLDGWETWKLGLKIQNFNGLGFFVLRRFVLFSAVDDIA
jgi:hypothetical protein